MKTPRLCCLRLSHLAGPCLLALVTLLLASLGVSTAAAQTVLIDLGDNFSDMSAQNWNTMIFNQAVMDLIDDTGAPTGISFTPLFWGGDFQNSANWIEDTDWVLEEAATDHFGGFSVSFITLGNLNGLYKVEIVCAHPQTNHLTDITVNSLFSDGNFQNIMGVNGDDFDPKVDGRDAQNWLIWSNVASVNGEIQISVTKLAGTNAISVSAIRLTRVGDLGTSEISVTTGASPETLPEPGGWVDFDIRIDNVGTESVELTSLVSDTYGNLDGQGDCSLPQTIAADGFYECTFPEIVSGNAGDMVTNIISALGFSALGAASDDSPTTVTITDALPSATVSKTASPESLPEPGGDVTFAVEVSNTGAESLTLTSLVDDIHGDLNGQGDCSVPQAIGPGMSYSCSFMASVMGDAGASETDTVTATLSDDEMNSTTPSDSATVTITDVLPTASVTKAASPEELPEPGGDVTFSVDIENTGTAKSLTLTSLVDDIHGDLNGQGDCSVPQVIAAGATYSCSFTVAVNGNAGDTETDTITATLTDNEENSITPQGSATVTLTDALPQGTVSKFNGACGTTIDEPGGTIAFQVRVNNSGDEELQLIDLMDDVYGDLDGLGNCSLPQTLAAQASYACTFDGNFNGVVGDSETSTLTATLEDDESNQTTPSDTLTIEVVAAGTKIFGGCFEEGDFSEWFFSTP